MTDNLLNGQLYSWAHLRTNTLETELLKVNDTLSVTGDVTYDGDAVFNGDASFNQGADFGDNVVINGTLEVRDTATFRDAVQADTTLNVNGAITGGAQIQAATGLISQTLDASVGITTPNFIGRRIEVTDSIRYNPVAPFRADARYFLNQPFVTENFPAVPGSAAVGNLEVRVREIAGFVTVMFTYPPQVNPEVGPEPLQWTSTAGFLATFHPITTMEFNIIVFENGKDLSGRLQIDPVGNVRVVILDPAQPTGERGFTNAQQAGITGTASVSYINNSTLV